jgi:seryl-tRNA synthetase
MIDPKVLREQTQAIAQRLATRGFELPMADFSALEAERKTLQTSTQALQNQRNQSAKAIGQAKAKGEDVQPLLDAVQGLGAALSNQQAQLQAVQDQLQSLTLQIPNLPHPTVPLGNSEADNQQLRCWGELPRFAFTPKHHFELGEAMQLMDFEAATKLSGSRYVVLKGDLVRLHRALVSFMLDIHRVEHGYQEVYVPFIVNAEALYGTGQLPKFANDQFKLDEAHESYLIPTAEVPVTNLARERIFTLAELPQRYACHTPCFRREAGSYGRDTQGMLRQHQFEKVELVWMTTPDTSYQALETLVQHAETILQRLALPYRVMGLCTADLGFSAAKTYDLEVWLPAQNQYREISSCSNCEDFQARRMQARFRDVNDRKPQLIHTLNGSGLAVGRTLIAIMENYQDEKGVIHIPEALQAYMGGQTQLVASD